MSTLELKVYDIFKNKLGEQEASCIIEYIESQSEKKYLEKKEILATKDDLQQVKFDLIKWFFVTLSFMIIGLYFKA